MQLVFHFGCFHVRPCCHLCLNVQLLLQGLAPRIGCLLLRFIGNLGFLFLQVVQVLPLLCMCLCPGEVSTCDAVSCLQVVTML